jgi:protein-S-isoprenylcysteine O-methyltransferase Ste14
MQATPWWRGTRGEWYVVAQFVLLGLVLAAPWLAPQPAWPAPWSRLAQAAGVLLLLLGGALAVAGVLNLGRNLSPLPHPKAGAALVETGLYSLVRHPIYSGLIAGCLGWALVHNSLITLLLAVAVFVFFDVKARREERALSQHFPAYARYRQRVRRFIPFIY